MTWQKALFFGGAILLLTACSSTTGPTEPTQLRVMSGSANLAVSKSSGSAPDSMSVQTGYYVRTGATIEVGDIIALP